MQHGPAEPKLLRWLVFVPPLVALVLAWRLKQPSVFPDEIGALLNARRLAGLGGASPWWYLPGYGALLVPIVALTDDPTRLIRGAQVINGVLMVVSTAGLAVSLRIFASSTSERNRSVAAVLAMLTPSYLYFAGFAVADNAIVAMGAWLAPATNWLRRTHRAAALPIGFVSAALATSVHSRAVILPLAVAVGLSFDRELPDRIVRALALLLGVLVGRPLSSSLLDTAGGSVLAGTGRTSTGSLVGDNLTIEGLATLPATLLGQAFSITVGSVGIVALGFVYAMRLRPMRNDRRAPAVSVFAAVLGAAASSVLFTNGGSGDFALYARYVEVSLPVVLALGWLGVLERTVRPSIVLAGLVAASGMLLVLLRGSETFDGRIQRLNVAGLAPFVRLGDGLQPVWIGLLGGTAILLFSAALRARVSLGVAGVLAVFGFAAIDNVNASQAFVDVAGGPPAIAADVDALEYDGCIAFDQTDLEDFWFHENFRLHRLDWDFRFWPEQAAAPCGDVVVSSRTDLGSQLPGWAPVAVEPGLPQWVWVSAELRDEHSLDPLVTASLGAPLTDPSGSIEIAVVSTSDQEMVVQLAILNTGVETFIPAANLPGGIGGVQVGLEWRSTAQPSERSMEPIRVALPRLLHPGESVSVTAVFPRVEPEAEHILHAELVQEGVGWIDSIAASLVAEAGS